MQFSGQSWISVLNGSGETYGLLDSSGDQKPVQLWFLSVSMTTGLFLPQPSSAASPVSVTKERLSLPISRSGADKSRVLVWTQRPQVRVEPGDKSWIRCLHGGGSRNLQADCVPLTLLPSVLLPPDLSAPLPLTRVSVFRGGARSFGPSPAGGLAAERGPGHHHHLRLLLLLQVNKRLVVGLQTFSAAELTGGLSSQNSLQSFVSR